MSGSHLSCGACKFLKRKCIQSCIFAPFFCHEEGAFHFEAIHKVFGARNASNLLTQLSVNDRYGAAISLVYEALTRLQDPTYGCVSYIFTLQQQIIDLEFRLALLQELLFTHFNANHLNIQNWFQPETYLNPYYDNVSSLVDDPNLICNFENPIIQEKNVSFPYSQEASLQHYLVEPSSSHWPFPGDIDELGFVVFGNHHQH